jgi:hypothetical protein
VVRDVSRRLLAGGALALLVGGIAGLGALASPAAASPKNKPKPTVIIITGDGLTDPLTVRANKTPGLFAALHGEVAYLSGTGQAPAPKANGLGPKYTVVVGYDDKPTYTYDLYPLATGGPKAFRPAKQPNKAKTTAAWFFGRIGMSETLRAAGVPLPEKPDAISGGVAGSERVVPDDTLNAGHDLDELLTELQKVLLLNGAVVLVITTALAGIALLVRHRTR